MKFWRSPTQTNTRSSFVNFLSCPRVRKRKSSKESTILHRMVVISLDVWSLGSTYSSSSLPFPHLSSVRQSERAVFLWNEAALRVPRGLSKTRLVSAPICLRSLTQRTGSRLIVPVNCSKSASGQCALLMSSSWSFIIHKPNLECNCVRNRG